LGSTWGYGSVHPGQLQCSPNNSYPYGCAPQTNGTNVPQVKIDTPPLRCCFFIISWCSNLKVVEACRSYSAKIFLDPSWSQQWKVDFGPPIFHSILLVPKRQWSYLRLLKVENPLSPTHLLWLRRT
jgi:hypothetical protein